VNALDRQRGGPDDNSAQAGHLIAAPLTSGSHPNSNAPGRRQDDVNLVTTSNGDPGTIQRGSLVRRLTPVECERLMSWPDDWTAVDGPDTPDSRRYAACGDGVVSNVSEWLARGILAEVAA
jgi:site-specific DNA-cytosine methylase